MARFIFFVILILILYYLLHRLIRDMSPRKKGINRTNDPEELVQDPFCQTYVPKSSALKKRITGKDYYFCNPECAEKFLQKKDS